MSYPSRHESFKRRLRLAIEEEGISIYGLARKLDPDNPERAERYLHRWLSPTTTTLPSRANREALARALGRDVDFFAPRPGAGDLEEIASWYSMAERHEEAVLRRIWLTGPDGRFLEDLRPSRRLGVTA